MIGIDTNILVRFLTNDDPEQAQKVGVLLDNNDIFVPNTVLLETEWMLRYAYKITKIKILNSFNLLLGLPGLTVEDLDQVTIALSWYEKGLDFADAMHLATSQKYNQFATFDKELRKKVSDISSIEIFEPPHLL
ncbi:MAG: hypothetical protein A2161_15430 [Candidatus Schekmanbacteria bacterium RBG_13_48_7]|uniref:PIN domain-containing protein n=1 Tax=Candidatus Schekmanbacteria bacterium RBG_13_48_7 TaxID=1817878 RepID=A0A1F7S1B1_9BACT|nr:MAG: hypothetical protein A2161_15430 [Candidatus Schekmanbacteria bacterium RBG_13_48_7]